MSLHCSVFSTTYITCPAESKKTLGIKLPFLVMIIKNMKKYFTFEVQVRIVFCTSGPLYQMRTFIVRDLIEHCNKFLSRLNLGIISELMATDSNVEINARTLHCVCMEK